MYWVSECRTGDNFSPHHMGSTWSGGESADYMLMSSAVNIASSLRNSDPSSLDSEERTYFLSPLTSEHPLTLITIKKPLVTY